MRLRAAAIAVPFCAVLLAATSCSSIPEDWRTPAFLQSGEEELDDRLPEVTGKFGKEPKVDFSGKGPLEEQASGVVEKGDGENELIRTDDVIQSDVVEYQWTAKGKAEKKQSTYEDGAPAVLGLSQLSEDMSGAMANQPVGTRMVFALPPQDPAQAQQMGQPSPPAGGTLLVFDIRDRYGKAEAVPGEQTSNGGGDLPTVKQDGHEQPDITIPKDTEPPEELETETLIEGSGPEIKAGQQLVVQYTGMRWDNGEVFDATWTREGAAKGVPTPIIIGDGQVIEGWDEGLVGKKVGSRMLLVIPPEKAYGKDPQEGAPKGTLVFVVDVLDAVAGAPSQEGSGDGGSGDGSGGDGGSGGE